MYGSQGHGASAAACGTSFEERVSWYDSMLGSRGPSAFSVLQRVQPDGARHRLESWLVRATARFSPKAPTSASTAEVLALSALA